MKLVMIFSLPILVLLPLFGMIMFCYPVRKTDDIITIGYPIFCKEYSIFDSTFDVHIEQFRGFRGSSWNVVVNVYDSNSETLIRRHILQGYMLRKNAEKELEKVKQIIFS